ncbi:MAG: helix-turn-helix domain-containing protein [Frankiaceae bacterium]
MAVSIGERIRDLRMQRKLSQSELARRVKVAPSYISLLEAGHRLPREDFLRRLAPHLGATVDHLLTGRQNCEDFDVELRMGEGCLLRGETDTAYRLFSQVLADAPELTCVGQRQRAQWGLVGVYERTGHFRQALEELEQLLAVPDLPAGVSRTRVITEYCFVLRRIGEWRQALKIGTARLEELASLPAGSPEREGQTELASTLVGCYRDGGLVTEAQALARQAIENSRGSLVERGAAYWAAALNLAQDGDRDTARTYLDSALALYSEAANARAVASLQLNSAWLILQDAAPLPAEIKRAEGLLQDALQTLRVAGASAEVAGAEIELGRCYVLLKRFDEAEAAAARAESVLPPEAVVEVAHAKQLRADIQAERGEVTEAGNAYRAIADQLHERGLDGETKALMRELAEKLRKLDQPHHAMEVYRYLAEAAKAVPADG